MLTVHPVAHIYLRIRVMQQQSLYLSAIEIRYAANRLGIPSNMLRIRLEMLATKMEIQSKMEHLVWFMLMNLQPQSVWTLHRIGNGLCNDMNVTSFLSSYPILHIKFSYWNWYLLFRWNDCKQVSTWNGDWKIISVAFDHLQSFVQCPFLCVCVRVYTIANKTRSKCQYQFY